MQNAEAEGQIQRGIEDWLQCAATAEYLLLEMYKTKPKGIKFLPVHQDFYNDDDVNTN